RIKVMSSGSWRGLYCVDPGVYDIAGNEISIHHQPHEDTTAPSVVLVGQMNDLFALPWDWDAVSGTAGNDALIIAAGSRFTKIRSPILPVNLHDLSGEQTNI